jgi:hypothetical protein
MTTVAEALVRDYPLLWDAARRLADDNPLTSEIARVWDELIAWRTDDEK